MVPLLCIFGNTVYLGMVQKRYDGMNIWIPLNPTVWSVCRSLSLSVSLFVHPLSLSLSYSSCFTFLPLFPSSCPSSVFSVSSSIKHKP